MKNEKKTYVSPTIEVVELESEDIIRTSTFGDRTGTHLDFGNF